MNFKTALQQGKLGKNKGLPTGLKPLDKAINGVQRKSIYGLAAPPKAGKTTLADFSFVIHPYLYALEHSEVDLEYIYFSYEIDRVSKEFDFVAFFFYYDYQIESFRYKGKEYKICSAYLLGKMQDAEGNQIPLLPEFEEKIDVIYKNRIIPLFGEYDENGNQISKGIITFIEAKDNPTGMHKFILAHAEKNGTFVYEQYKDSEGVVRKRPVGFKPKNPDKITMILVDHLRKMSRERGFTMKENVDKFLEYAVIGRNLLGYSYLLIIHLNRNLSSIERLKYNGEFLYPMSDDIKDTGNLSEDANYMLTLFNAADEKYGIETHFGVELADYPNYRSIHLVESRDTECPLHIQVQMQANVKSFKPI